MLSAADNELLVRSGPGTAMGEYFRRYWLPVLLSRELPEPDGAPMRVQVLGEELVAFRDTQGRVGLMLNVERTSLPDVLALLPALQQPTISPLSDERWVAVNTIIEERTVRDLIPKVKAAGGQGIVEYPLNKIVM